MAGLMDLFDDPQMQLGLGLLAAAAPRADGAGFGQRLMEGVNSSIAMRKAQQQEKMLQMQAEAAQRKAEMTNEWLQRIKDSQSPSYSALQQGASVGDVGPTVGNAARMTALSGNPAATQSAGLNGISPNAMFADLVFNDGKQVGQWMYDRSKPNIEIINGVAVDKNRIAAGDSMPVISQNGTASQLIKDTTAPGGWRVIAPAGSVDVFKGYEQAKVGVANSNELIEVPAGDGSTIRMTKADAIQKLSGAPKSSIPSVGSVQPSAQDMAIIEADAKANGIQNPFVNFKGQPSQLGRTLSKAEEARQVKTAEADVARNTANQSDAKRFGQMQEGITRAINLLNQGPTESGVGAAVDAGLAAFGKSTKGADIAAQLSALSGWLTSNVPRMEGPQSNIDVMNYQVQAGMVGDRTKPVSQRIAAAKEVMRLQQKYAELNGYADKSTNTGDAKQTDAKSWQDYNYRSPAAAIQDAQNAIMKNPAAKAEVIRRLKSMGLDLPSGASGAW